MRPKPHMLFAPEGDGTGGGHANDGPSTEQDISRDAGDELQPLRDAVAALPQQQRSRVFKMVLQILGPKRSASFLERFRGRSKVPSPERKPEDDDGNTDTSGQ